jgi:hypothetical protein
VVLAGRFFGGIIGLWVNNSVIFNRFYVSLALLKELFMCYNFFYSL